MKKLLRIRLLLALGGLIVGVLLLGLIVRGQVATLNQQDEFHEHANFAVFLNGERFDFAKSEFMNVKPCTAYEKSMHFVDTAFAHGNEAQIDLKNAELEDYLHLHDLNGDTIHVHKAGYTYADFFASLDMILTDEHFENHEGIHYENDDENSLRFFLNNEEVTDLPVKEIRDLDRVLITYGPAGRSQASINEELIQVANNACVESGTCAHRGTVSIESCGSAKEPSWLLEILGIV